MRFAFAAISVMALAGTLFASPAFAADCYHASKCSNCESIYSVESACQWFCGNGYWQQSTSFPWGYGHITLNGAFNAEINCITACTDIVQQCYG